MNEQQTEAIDEAIKTLHQAKRNTTHGQIAWNCKEAIKKLESIKETLAQQGEPEQEPLNTPLPCDVTVGNVIIRKGCALSLLVALMQDSEFKKFHSLLCERPKGEA